MRAAAEPLHAYRPGNPERLAKLGIHLEDQPEKHEDPMLRCERCGRDVAREKDRIEVQGAHVHTRMNPAGILFTLGCFLRAEGARPEGEAHLAWSWFPGYSWTIDLCRGCSSHLGWLFEAGTDCFHGLILDRLR